MTSEETFFGCGSSGESAGTSSSTKNDKEVPYICEKCGHGFQNKASVLSHLKWKHENPNSHICSVCQKIFARKYRLDRHEQSCRNKGTNKAEVLKHYEVTHQINIAIKTLNFVTIEEFKIWKQEFEKETKSRFIKATRTQHGKNGVDTSKYICHRDGCFRSRGKGVRHIKMLGSNKINSHCPANIVVRTTNHSSVEVVYMGTHVGHELDLRRLNISKSEKVHIAEKLAMKIPFKQILDDIRSSVVNNKLDRIHLATRKDLWNIVDSFNLNHESVSTKEESPILSPKQHSFDKRKQDMLNKLLQVCNMIENEEQLEAVLKQVHPLESIINELSKKDIPNPKNPKESHNKTIKMQVRFSSTKKKMNPINKKYTNPSVGSVSIGNDEIMGKIICES